MSESQVLKAQKRSQMGSRASRQLRAEGMLPANIQGDGMHVDIAIGEREFLASRRAHVHLYDIEVDGEVESAVVRELQWDTFGDNLLHVEFKKVTRGVETESEVAIEFAGMPKGGVVNHLMDTVTIRCIPSLIPDSLEVSVDGLEAGAHVKASQIVLPEGITLAIDADSDVATIVGGGGDEAAEEEAEDGEAEEA